MTTYKPVQELMAESSRLLKESTVAVAAAWDDFNFQWDLRRSIEKRDAIVYYFVNGKWPEPKTFLIRPPHKFNRIAE